MKIDLAKFSADPVFFRAWIMDAVPKAVKGFSVRSKPQHRHDSIQNVRVWHYKLGINFDHRGTPFYVPVVISMWRESGKDPFNAFVSVPQTPESLLALKPFTSLWGKPLSVFKEAVNHETLYRAYYKVRS